MELQQVFEVLNKRLESFNEKIHFTPVKENGVKAGEISVFAEDDCHFLRYTGKSGSYKVIVNDDTKVLTLECSADNSQQAEYKEMLKCLFDYANAEEREIKSVVNELTEELLPLYQERKKDLAAVKLPKSASKSAIKNGALSYTDLDLATRFTDQYSDLKDAAKEIMLQYDELLPETFFMKHGAPFVMDMLRHKDDAQLKKLFKLLNEVFENGTNAAQDVIAVTILGEMKNDPVLLETADQYMCEYMTGPVHEVNKLIGKKGLQKRLQTPPPYKPKKAKTSKFTSLLNGQPPQQ